MKMDCFIKKIFEGKNDDFVHHRFQKFSKGTFADKALVRVTRGAKGFTMWTGAEYANELVRAVAEKLGSNKAKITGPVVSTLKLKENPALQGLLANCGLKQFAGVKQYLVNTEVSGHEIIKCLDAAPEGFFALSFTAGDTTLKIKAKAPKSAKPSTSEKAAKADFCNLKTSDSSLIAKFVWETGWKSFEANHTFVINDITLPSGVTDPSELRKKAKRKGEIIRKIIIDSVQKTEKHNFEA
jgi:hypothetical protein